MNDVPIIVRITNGLGNQLFQYALGRHLSILHKRLFKLDVSYFTADRPDAKRGIRMYGLGHFNIQAEIADEEDLRLFQKYLKKNIVGKLFRRLSSLGAYYNHKYIFEPPRNYFVFDPKLVSAKLSLPVCLEGFWQSEKYFLPVEQVIRSDFTFKELPDGQNKAILEEIKACDSVCIHIRHGDNATKLAAKHGVLPMEYYYKAVRQLTATVKNPDFYVFSDDLDWAKENLKLNFPVNFVSHNGDEKNYEDLRLMAGCKHHIIGNSSFSWWGAWLGKKPGQLVFAPERYHVRGTVKAVDFYPESWQRLQF